jgi:two-component system sensor histidine kinase CpxA
MHFSAELRDQMIHLTVSDNGPGVPDEELSRIFAPFYRLDPARGRETGGTGLGLAIVRTCIEACGGEVSASLAPEGGLRIHLKLLPFRDDLSSSR